MAGTSSVVADIGGLVAPDVLIGGSTSQIVFVPGGAASPGVVTTEAALNVWLATASPSPTVYYDLSNVGGTYTVTTNWDLKRGTLAAIRAPQAGTSDTLNFPDGITVTDLWRAARNAYLTFNTTTVPQLIFSGTAGGGSSELYVDQSTIDCTACVAPLYKITGAVARLYITLTNFGIISGSVFADVRGSAFIIVQSSTGGYISCEVDSTDATGKLTWNALDTSAFMNGVVAGAGLTYTYGLDSLDSIYFSLTTGNVQIYPNYRHVSFRPGAALVFLLPTLVNSQPGEYHDFIRTQVGGVASVSPNNGKLNGVTTASVLPVTAYTVTRILRVGATATDWVIV